MLTLVGLSSTIRMRPGVSWRSVGDGVAGSSWGRGHRHVLASSSSFCGRRGQGQLAVEDAAGRALFSAQMRPWWPATISRQMARPRPVPPWLDLVLLDWTNLSKTVSSSSARNSRPFVADAHQHALPTLADAHVDGPSGGENFTALLRRLRTTCLNAFRIDQGDHRLPRPLVADAHLLFGRDRAELVDHHFDQFRPGRRGENRSIIRPASSFDRSNRSLTSRKRVSAHGRRCGRNRRNSSRSAVPASFTPKRA